MKRPIKGTFNAGGNEITYCLYCKEDGVWWFHCAAFDFMDVSTGTSCSSVAKKKAHDLMFTAYEDLLKSM